MFQYYLRAAGIMPAWIGTGRFIFSHATTEAEFEDIARRFVSAAEAMAADGWWWTNAELTTQEIKRTVSRELVRALLGRPVTQPRLAPPVEAQQPEIAARSSG
jgi:glutamate-1-semialdehyde 2,1-aminomutase